MSNWQPNRCSICGKFRKWNDLVLNFVPDTPFSSEDDSYRVCQNCRPDSFEKADEMVDGIDGTIDESWDDPLEVTANDLAYELAYYGDL